MKLVKYMSLADVFHIDGLKEFPIFVFWSDFATAPCTLIPYLPQAAIKVNHGLHTSQVAHQASAYPGLTNMKRLGLFLLPPWMGC